VPQLEPGHRPPATPPPPPPRREARNELKPPGRLPHPGQHGAVRHLRATAIGDLHPDKTVPDHDRDRDRPARSPTGYAGHYCRTARSPSRAASSPTGDRDRAPADERACDPRPVRPPGHRHALPDLQPSHQRTHLPRPPPPPGNHRGRQAGRTGMHARLSGSRQAGTRDRRGPSVAVRGKPTVHTDRPSGWTPSAICPWTPRHSGPRRYKVTHDGTEKKRPA
jgi:hypothetical protein